MRQADLHSDAAAAEYNGISSKSSGSKAERRMYLTRKETGNSMKDAQSDGLPVLTLEVQFLYMPSVQVRKDSSEEWTTLISRAKF